MLVAFTNKAGASIEMFEDAAMELIGAMDRRQAVPSAIKAEDVPGALAALKAKLETADEESGAEGCKPDAENDKDTPKVDLKVRAYPLLEMLERAAESGSYIMWDYK